MASQLFIDDSQRSSVHPQPAENEVAESVPVTLFAEPPLQAEIKISSSTTLSLTLQSKVRTCFAEL